MRISGRRFGVDSRARRWYNRLPYGRGSVTNLVFNASIAGLGAIALGSLYLVLALAPLCTGDRAGFRSLRGRLVDWLSAAKLRLGLWRSRVARIHSSRHRTAS